MVCLTRLSEEVRLLGSRQERHRRPRSENPFSFSERALLPVNGALFFGRRLRLASVAPSPFYPPFRPPLYPFSSTRYSRSLKRRSGDNPDATARLFLRMITPCDFFNSIGWRGDPCLHFCVSMKATNTHRSPALQRRQTRKTHVSS